MVIILNYGNIKKTDIANGIGVRVSLFVSGCTRHCKNCFNRETWDFSYGKPYTKDTENEIIDELSKSYINGLTVLGGEPFELSNQRGILPLLHRVRRELPDKTIWCYTGCTLESDLLKDGYWRCEVTDEILSLIDVLVDGPFIEALNNVSLQFKGSSNQRIIDMKATLACKRVVLWKDNIKDLISDSLETV